MFTQRYYFEKAEESLKRAVWQKGQRIPGYDQAEWRQDSCGRAIRYSDHADTTSQYGWEIDHIVPKAKGGGDELSNLQPLYWENNRRKGDTYPWHCENAA